MRDPPLVSLPCRAVPCACKQRKEGLGLLLYCCTQFHTFSRRLRHCCISRAFERDCATDPLQIFHPFIHSSLYSFIHSSIHSFINSLIDSLIHSFIYSFTHSLIHLFIHSSFGSFCTNVGTARKTCTWHEMLLDHIIQKIRPTTSVWHGPTKKAQGLLCSIAYSCTCHYYSSM